MTEGFDYKFWWTFALSVYGLVVGWALWLRSPGEEAGKAVTKLRDDVMKELRTMHDLMSREVAEMRGSQGKLEERVSHLPDAQDLMELAGDVRELKARTEGLVNSQTGQTMALARIENYLMNRGHK